MTSVKFIAHVANTRELCQLSWNKEIICRDQQTMFCAEILVECASDDRGIDLEFLIRTEVPFSRLTEMSENRDQAVSVGSALAKRGIPLIAQYPFLRIYGGESLSIPGEDLIPNESNAYQVELTEQISAPLATQLSEATERHRDCTRRFEKAKDYLEKNTDFYGEEPARSRSNARFVAEYMCKSSEPYMGAWNSEKSSVLVHYVEDLIRRKNTSHSGYVHAAEWIRSTLYSVRPSKLWHSHPL